MRRILFFLMAGIAMSLITILLINSYSNKLFLDFVKAEDECALAIKEKVVSTDHLCYVEPILEMETTNLSSQQSRVVEAYNAHVGFSEKYIVIIPSAILFSFIIAWFLIYAVFRLRKVDDGSSRA